MIQLVLTIWKPGTGYQKWHYSIMATRSFSISAGPTPTSSQDVSFRKKGRAGGRPSYGDEVGPALDGRREAILKKGKIIVNRNRNWTWRFPSLLN